MNIVILNGSPRKNGNTEIMVDTFLKGAEKSGNQVQKFNLGEMKVAPCLGCSYCLSHDGECVQKDDMKTILEAVDTADMLVLASPIYWFSVTGQTKCAIDRLYARARKGFHIQYTGLLLDSGAEGVFDSAISLYKATNSYVGWKDRGIITIGGMTKKGDMSNHAKLEEVYQFGESLI